MISTRRLTKRYGSTVALAGVDISVPDGSIYGLAGPNGAGKTTLLGIIAGLRDATEGTLKVDAEPHQVAVLSDTPRFEPWLTGREVVELAANLTGADASRASIDKVLGDTGLGDAADRRNGGYSRGMLQRLGIACVLVGKPRLILLDEPASALDPLGRREVLDLIARLRGSATVVFSSHILGDVQEVCDTVGVLRDGSLLFEGPIEQLLVGRAVPRYDVKVRSGALNVALALARARWVASATAVGDTAITLEVTSLADAEARLARALADAGAAVVSMAPEQVSLERAFLELTRGEAA